MITPTWCRSFFLMKTKVSHLFIFMNNTTAHGLEQSCWTAFSESDQFLAGMWYPFKRCEYQQPQRSKVFANSDLNASYLAKLADMHNPVIKHCIIYVHLPRNAPFWFDALNGGVVYILKSQDPSDLCTIHAHGDLNRPHTRQRRGRVTHDLRHSPSEDKANRYKLIRFWEETKHDTKF